MLSIVPADVGIAQQIERRQFGRRYLHAAGVGLMRRDGVSDRRHVLAVEKCR